MAELRTGDWKGGSTATVPFGLKDGRLWFVTDVETGLACGCRCPDPSCDQPLVARNRPSESRQRAYHFQHAARTASCGGRESALHRMAKELLVEAATLTLPRWDSDGVAAPPQVVALAPGARAEVLLLDGQTRPDVSVLADVGTASPVELQVEVRVHHAVDDAKARLVRSRALTMLEIDLSGVPDEVVVDRETFTRCVLHDPDNRRWVHVASGSLAASLLGAEVIEVVDAPVEDVRIPFKKGDGHYLHSRQSIVSHVAGRDPWPTTIELESYVGDPSLHRDQAGRVVHHSYSRVAGPTLQDRGGTPLPYAPGLYLRGASSNRFKTRLVPLPQPKGRPEGQGQLFE